MLSGLQEEIALHTEFTGASKDIIVNALNADGTAQTETWIVMDDVLKIPKGDILALLSFASQVALYDWMKAESNEAKGFSLFYNSHDQFKVNDPVFRGTISLLNNPLSIITESERDAILRLGERKISRSEEIWNRLLTVEDFE